jgi:hypothetical protein
MPDVVAFQTFTHLWPALPACVFSQELENLLAIQWDLAKSRVRLKEREKTKWLYHLIG